MSNFLKQQREESLVLENFFSVYDFPVIKGSVRHLNPPFPDMVCRLENGVSVEFELANAVDPQLAQKMNDNRITNKGGFCNNEPIEEIILNKNNKLALGKYALHADRIELLVYLGLTPVWPYWHKRIPQFLEKNKTLWSFDRIWIFRDDRFNPRILWSY